MSAPFEALAGAELGTLLAITAGATLAWSRLFPSLATPAAPRGIVSLQLAWTSERAAAVLLSWRDRDRIAAAKRSIVVDFPFIALYSFAFAFLALLAGRAAEASDLLSSANADSSGGAAAIAAWTAGCFDLVENGGLLLLVRGSTRQPLPAVTSTLAAAKWVLVLATGLFSVGLLVTSAVKALGCSS